MRNNSMTHSEDTSDIRPQDYRTIEEYHDALEMREQTRDVDRVTLMWLTVLVAFILFLVIAGAFLLKARGLA